MLPIVLAVNGLQYNPITYYGNPPLPPVPCVDPLPQQMRELGRMNQIEIDNAKAAIAAERRLNRPSGLRGRLSLLANEATLTLDRTVNDITYRANGKFATRQTQIANSRFRTNFPQLQNEFLVGTEHRCTLGTQNGDLNGYLMFTNNHLLFLPDNGIGVGIPLVEILSVQRLIEAKTVDRIAHFIGCDQPEVRAQAIQFFLTTGQLLLFKNFISLRAMSASLPVTDVYNIFDHVWRSSMPIPVPHVMYIAPENFRQPQYGFSPPARPITGVTAPVPPLPMGGYPMPVSGIPMAPLPAPGPAPPVMLSGTPVPMHHSATPIGPAGVAGTTTTTTTTSITPVALPPPQFTRYERVTTPAGMTTSMTSTTA